MPLPENAGRWTGTTENPKKLVITGNIKFDLVIPNELILQGKNIRQQIGVTRRVLIAASTHESEDQIVIDAFIKIRKEIPNLFLILAPHHHMLRKFYPLLYSHRKFLLFQKNHARRRWI